MGKHAMEPPRGRPGRRLLSRWGPRRFALAFGGWSVLVSVLVTVVVQAVLFGGQVLLGLLVAVVVPALLAPPLAWYLASLAVEAEDAWRVAERLAATDALTGLLNRRRFHEVGVPAFQSAQAAEEPMAVLLLDVDNFKSVNDRFGHAVGDRLLQHVALACESQLRDTDVLARWGGEEFVVLLPAATATTALEIGERLRAAVEGLRVDVRHGQVVSPTVSIGVNAGTAVTSVSGGPEGFDGAPEFDRFIEGADRAMYAAKRGGKNRVSSLTPA
ncbi:MAG TPA: GGDEF domain-containing protein [Nocardioidaceae bacterium]|nr:GGDEF domain-containing protein [Nocardioidaceae bacterium]